jgi:hypothetical protein
MKEKSFLSIALLLIILACSKDEINPDKVIDLNKVEKYEVVCDKISRAAFEEGFQSGWYCVSICDVFADGTLGGVDLYDEIDPSSFSVRDNNTIKIYDSFVDYSGTQRTYRTACYSYDENGNILSLVGYHTVYYSNPGVYVSLTGGCVVSLTETEMHLLAPAWRYGSSDPEAVYTLFKFNKLSTAEIEKLDLMHTEEN